MKRFRLRAVDEFDARRGYVRCDPPGMGVRIGKGPDANADFWRDRQGNLVVRCSSQGYRMHLAAALADGSAVPPSAMDELCDFLAEVLLDWIVEGVDDDPDCLTELADERLAVQFTALGVL